MYFIEENSFENGGGWRQRRNWDLRGEEEEEEEEEEDEKDCGSFVRELEEDYNLISRVEFSPRREASIQILSLYEWVGRRKEGGGAEG